MITRQYTADGIVSRAKYSDCEHYRYLLERVWDGDRGVLMYVMLNPSKANERDNDPTIERCQRRAVQLGYGGISITNLFAWRETHPSLLKKSSAPVGPANDRVMLNAARGAKTVLAAWGVHGTWMDRNRVVLLKLKNAKPPLVHLGLTKEGHPRHPLYVPYAQQLQPWQ
ncbi:hypothetical protein ACMU_03130 [Actibacterium mucosum KCTC 23349]|uniref:DUF1643 domain-containing protein n=1 Tax=Actibacterium mucosum KCTC 23349 TaxID=1454373 RepID=A0A037ZN58_9RHOB|nr:DUF1643 domain-containing protein [Actibacterium mucosum]KAJ57514.1 hypothetical protein ACMU_03130 [Actibacterium mucosum KCTC 23349]